MHICLCQRSTLILQWIAIWASEKCAWCESPHCIAPLNQPLNAWGQRLILILPWIAIWEMCLMWRPQCIAHWTSHSRGMGSKVESNVIMKSNQGCLKIAFFHPDLVYTSVIPHLADGLNGTLYVCMAMYSRVSLLWATAYISCHCWDLLNSILLHCSSAGRLLCGQQKPWSYGQIHAFLAFILHRIGMILLRLLRLCLCCGSSLSS